MTVTKVGGANMIAHAQWPLCPPFPRVAVFYVTGVQMLYISKETNKICDFSGSSGATIPPLDLRMYPIALNFGLGPSNWRKCPQTQWLLNVLSTFYVKF